MSYGTNDGLDTHWTARGYDNSALTSTAKDQLRAIATTFVDGLGWRETPAGTRFNRFPGQPATADQADAWPRKGASDIYGNVIADDSVPGAVERAVYEAAFFEHENAGALNAAIRADGIIKSEKTGPLSAEFFEPKDPATATRQIIPFVETFLAPVLTGGENPYGITGVVV